MDILKKIIWESVHGRRAQKKGSSNDDAPNEEDDGHGDYNVR